MLIAVVVLAVIAVGLLVGVVMGQQARARLERERDEVQGQLDETRGQFAQATGKLEETTGQLTETRRELKDTESRRSSLEAGVKELEAKLGDSQDALRKRTELADAQATQIDAISAERDDLKTQLVEAEERIVTLAARPGIVVGDTNLAAPAGGDAQRSDAAMLWGLEQARSERAWRNSVAINPIDDPSPFDSTDDPVRQAVEIEAAALREDVGAMITVDWQAKPIDDPARRLMVVRVAQELLATAAKAPGAATLVVADTDDGELTMSFNAEDQLGDGPSLIPAQVSSDLIDVRNETTVAVRAAAVTVDS